MKPGVYEGISNAEYHGGPGISKSGLDLVHRSPMHYNAVVTAANDRTPTPAQEIGTAVHMAILEPEEFAKTYCMALRRSDVPDAIDDREVLVEMVNKLNEARLAKLSTSGNKDALIDRIVEFTTGWGTREELEAMKVAELKAFIERVNEKRTGLLSTSGSRHELANLLRENGVEVTLWSDVLEEWQRNNSERKVLSPEAFEQIFAMRDSVMNHPAAFAILHHVKDIIGDLKTTEDASPEGFAKSIANWRYDVQHAYYIDGTRLALEQGKCNPPQEGKAELSVYWTDPVTGVLCRCRPDFWRGYPKHFAFIAVEKKPPYAVGVYVLDSEGVEIGRAQYQHDLRVYAECVRSGEWPGYGDKVQTISLPGWHANKNAHLVGAA
ncbi:exonuclease VIII [Escherichia phage vB_EcoM_ECO1230-10]|uniref:Conserved phage protein n=1 Tax=Escherichia phage vB_EcoM_ECO1230-10 TaxID=669875 RepID=D5LH26_9CAUD|nr:exonuclease VIII [Escherichia phage vB_EcoM_ECO1230-10]ADE87957.1 conserved phage protein [Escherichia phage vB_EcoM_ECO1230-10]